jgi:hypothetical protein
MFQLRWFAADVGGAGVTQPNRLEVAVVGVATLCLPLIIAFPLTDYLRRDGVLDLKQLSLLLFMGWGLAACVGFGVMWLRTQLDPHFSWESWPAAPASVTSLGVAAINAFMTFAMLPVLLMFGLLKLAALLLITPFRIADLFSKKKPDVLIGGEKVPWTPADQLTPEAVRLRAWMKRLSEPGFVFTVRETSGFSKLGGAPDLPEGMEWPHGADRPLEFLLQLDFAELPWGRLKRSAWLPADGRLYAFLVPDGPDRKDGVKLFYTPSEVSVQPAAAPEGVKTYPELPAGFHRFRAAPSLEWLGPEAEALDRQSGDQDLQLEAGGFTPPSFGGAEHYVGGYPQEIQWARLPVEAELSSRDVSSPWPVHHEYAAPVDAEIEKASKDWRLLLQISSDDRMGWHWVDAGQLYVLIRREDAKRRDFTRTVNILQFH